MIPDDWNSAVIDISAPFSTEDMCFWVSLIDALNVFKGLASTKNWVRDSFADQLPQPSLDLSGGSILLNQVFAWIQFLISATAINPIQIAGCNLDRGRATKRNRTSNQQQRKQSIRRVHFNCNCMPLLRTFPTWWWWWFWLNQLENWTSSESQNSVESEWLTQIPELGFQISLVSHETDTICQWYCVPYPWGSWREKCSCLNLA